MTALIFIGGLLAFLLGLLLLGFVVYEVAKYGGLYREALAEGEFLGKLPTFLMFFLIAWMLYSGGSGMAGGLS